MRAWRDPTGETPYLPIIGVSAHSIYERFPVDRAEETSDDRKFLSKATASPETDGIPRDDIPQRNDSRRPCWESPAAVAPLLAIHCDTN